MPNLIITPAKTTWKSRKKISSPTIILRRVISSHQEKARLVGYSAFYLYMARTTIFENLLRKETHLVILLPLGCPMKGLGIYAPLGTTLNKVSTLMMVTFVQQVQK